MNEALINCALTGFNHIQVPAFINNLPYATATAPSHTHSKIFSVHLLTQAKTNCSFFWGPFHCYDAHQSTPTTYLRRQPLAVWCAWSVQQTWRTRTSSGEQGSQRECRQTLFSTNSWHSTHKHTDTLPVLLYFPAFCFVKFPVTGIDCFIPDTYYDGLLHMHMFTETSKRKHNTTHMLLELWYTGSVASANKLLSWKPKVCRFNPQGWLFLWGKLLTFFQHGPWNLWIQTWLSWDVLKHKISFVPRIRQKGYFKVQSPAASTISK